MKLTKKSNRFYATGKLSALNHPMRITLYELIREGARTAPEMAEILDENRINLYHHLSKLEDAGLIESFYREDRVKKYRISKREEKPEVKTVEEALEKPVEFYTKTNTIVVFPPKDSKDRKKFRKKIKELLDIVDLNLQKSNDILQIHILSQPKSLAKEKQDLIKKVQDTRD